MQDISVIIPCFNAERWIEQTLQSVAAQDMGKIETIVIDDGSTDTSAAIVKKEFPRARLIKSEHIGVSAARNTGTGESRSEFVQYLDADDMLAPGKLKIQLEALQKTGADVAYGDWQKLIENKQGSFNKDEVVKKRLNDPEIDLFTDFWCPPAAYLFRRSIIEKIGGWNEGLPVIQDARFALDCALFGGKFIYCPGVMTYYRVHQSDSVSTRDSIAFVRDCLKNASEIEKWWQCHGGISEERQKALLKVYGYVARASFEKDRPTFESAHRELERLMPGYIPGSPNYLKLASQLFGYRRAEKLASWYRNTKIKISK